MRRDNNILHDLWCTLQSEINSQNENWCNYVFNNAYVVRKLISQMCTITPPGDSQHGIVKFKAALREREEQSCYTN